MAELREGLMQIFNGDNDPLFIELVGGNAFWIIPADKYKLSDVRFLTHLTDDGNLYFENMETGEVSWVFPSDDIMSESSRNNAISFQLMSRNEMENCLQAPFPESESFEQLAALDAYFDSSDGVQQQTDLADGTGSESSVPTVRPSGALRENTMNDEMNYSSDEGEGEDALAVINNKKDRLSLANSDAGSEGGDSSTPAGVSEPDSSPRPLSTLKSIETIKETTIKTGSLMKLAKKSKWNWKKRYFVLTPHHLAYYENDKPNQKIKGEIRITAETTVVPDTYDKKNGYHFIFTNQWESLTLSSPTEADRSQWILTINSTIKHAEDSLMGYAMLVHPAPTSTTAKSSTSAKTDPLAARKYFILSNNLLTYHPDEQKTSEIEGLINVNEHTVLDEIDDDQRLISLVDCDAQRSRFTIQFTAINIGAGSFASQYQRWKSAIVSMTKPRGATSHSSIEGHKRQSGMPLAGAAGEGEGGSKDIQRALSALGGADNAGVNASVDVKGSNLHRLDEAQVSIDDSAGTTARAAAADSFAEESAEADVPRFSMAAEFFEMQEGLMNEPPLCGVHLEAVEEEEEEDKGEGREAAANKSVSFAADGAADEESEQEGADVEESAYLSRFSMAAGAFELEEVLLMELPPRTVRLESVTEMKKEKEAGVEDKEERDATAKKTVSFGADDSVDWKNVEGEREEEGEEEGADGDDSAEVGLPRFSMAAEAFELEEVLLMELPARAVNSGAAENNSSAASGADWKDVDEKDVDEGADVVDEPADEPLERESLAAAAGAAKRVAPGEIPSSPSEVVAEERVDTAEALQALKITEESTGGGINDFLAPSEDETGLDVVEGAQNITATPEKTLAPSQDATLRFIKGEEAPMMPTSGAPDADGDEEVEYDAEEDAKAETFNSFKPSTVARVCLPRAFLPERIPEEMVKEPNSKYSWSHEDEREDGLSSADQTSFSINLQDVTKLHCSRNMLVLEGSEQCVVLTGTLKCGTSASKYILNGNKIFEWVRGAACSGWLLKWPISQFGRRMRRFFVLRDHILSYHVTRPADEEEVYTNTSLSSLKITENTTVEIGRFMLQRSLVVTTPMEKLCIRMQNGDVEEAKWIGKINKSIQDLQRKKLFMSKVRIESKWYHESDNFFLVAVDALSLGDQYIKVALFELFTPKDTNSAGSNLPTGNATLPSRQYSVNIGTNIADGPSSEIEGTPSTRSVQLVLSKEAADLRSELRCLKIYGDVILLGGSNGFLGVGAMGFTSSANAEGELMQVMFCVPCGTTQQDPSSSPHKRSATVVSIAAAQESHRFVAADSEGTISLWYYHKNKVLSENLENLRTPKKAPSLEDGPNRKSKRRVSDQLLASKPQSRGSLTLSSLDRYGIYSDERIIGMNFLLDESHLVVSTTKRLLLLLLGKRGETVAPAATAAAIVASKRRASVMSSPLSPINMSPASPVPTNNSEDADLGFIGWAELDKAIAGKVSLFALHMSETYVPLYPGSATASLQRTITQWRVTEEDPAVTSRFQLTAKKKPADGKNRCTVYRFEWSDSMFSAALDQVKYF